MEEKDAKVLKEVQIIVHCQSMANRANLYFSHKK